MPRRASLLTGTFLLLLEAGFAAAPPVSFRKPVDTTIADEWIADAALADLNGDGYPDLVVDTPNRGSISVASGLGDGAFATPQVYGVGVGTGDLAIGDVNNDGRLDVVVAASGIAVLLVNGEGSLQLPLYSGRAGRDLVLSDFDDDGILDVVSIGRNSSSPVPRTIDIYPGLGNGTFGQFITLFTTDNDPVRLAAGDFNGDRHPDLVFGETNARALRIWLNTGHLTFASAGSTFIDVGPVETAVGDVNGDGSVDAVIVNAIGTVAVLYGNGNGTLRAPLTLDPGKRPCQGKECPATVDVKLADINGDGLVDITLANRTPGSATVLVNNGNGRFGSTALRVSPYATRVVLSDVDANDSLDVLAINSDSDALQPGPRIASVFLNRSKNPKGEKGKDKP